MELKVDNSHDMINLEGLDLSNSKKVNVNIGSTDLTIFALSGSKKVQSNEMNGMFTKEEISDNEKVR